MTLNFINTLIGVFAVMLVLVTLLVGYLLVFTALFKNNKMRILDVNAVDHSLKEIYEKKFYQLLIGDFIKNTEDEFPAFKNSFGKKTIGDNILYESKNDLGKRILITIDFTKTDEKSNPTLVFDNTLKSNKALFFILVEAIDHLIKKNEFLVDLSIMIMNGVQKEIIENMDQQYSLIIEGNSGILDPITSKLRSHYAFLGTLNTGMAAIRFSTEKFGNGKTRMTEFIKEVNDEFKKSHLSKPIVKIMKNLGKDMPYSDRIIFTNPRIFFPFAKNVLYESKFDFLKGIKTKMDFKGLVETEHAYCVDCICQLEINKNLTSILKKITPILSKYSIDYVLLESVEQTKYVDDKSEDYRIFKTAIHETYNIYASQAITDGAIHKNSYDRIGECTINFSPVYGLHKAKINAGRDGESSFLVLGIEFYTKLLEEYSRRKKCIAQIVEKN